MLAQIDNEGSTLRRKARKGGSILLVFGEKRAGNSRGQERPKIQILEDRVRPRDSGPLGRQ